MQVGKHLSKSDHTAQGFIHQSPEKTQGWRETAQPLCAASSNAELQSWWKSYSLKSKHLFVSTHGCCLSPSVKSLAPSSGWPLVRCLGLLVRLPKADFSADWPSLPPSASPHRAHTSVTNNCGSTTLKSLQLVNKYLVPLKCLSRHTKLADMKGDL